MKHSLISPSNFERRMLCPGSLHAEKDLPYVRSKYADEGTMLHERVTLNIQGSGWDKGLKDAQKDAVLSCVEYLNSLKPEDDSQIIFEAHETKYDLSFIAPGMGGTADAVLILERPDNVEVHVIDYKFGKGVAVDAFGNYQLLLYYLGAVSHPQVQDKLKNKKRTAHLHIVQPFIKNSRWDLTEDDRAAFCNKSFYRSVAKECYKPDAKRIYNYSACMFCKAKTTCPEAQQRVRKIDDSVFDEFN